MAIFTLDDGPDWDDHTGSIFQRFGTRSLPLEAWLIWMLQLGFQRCNSFVKITEPQPGCVISSRREPGRRPATLRIV